MQAWVQPLRVVLCWVAYWLPKLAPWAGNAAVRWLVALHTSQSQPTLTLTWDYIASFWSISPYPLTWPYLDLNPDSRRPCIVGPPQHSNCGHTAFLSPGQSSGCLTPGLTLVTMIS